MTAKGKSESKEFLKVGEAVTQGFLAGVQYNSPDVVEAIRELGEDFKKLVDAYIKLNRAIVHGIAAILNDVNFAQLLKAAEVQAALKEATPRVRHMALHAKKKRVRKKYINRALREHRRKKEAKNDKA